MPFKAFLALVLFALVAACDQQEETPVMVEKPIMDEGNSSEF